MAPMTRWHSPDGVPGPDVSEYYARRAHGGVGLIITEGCNIDHPAASGYDDVPALFGKSALDGWRRVVEKVHSAGAAIVPQLWHVGAFRRVGVGPHPEHFGCGPHRIVSDGRLVVRRLSREGLADVVRSYGRAARAAAEVGFDGIEIHAAHGYLIDQFMRSKTNRRRDEFGGSIANRVRLAAEVVAEVRRQIPSRMPVIFRFSQWTMDNYDAQLVESPEDLRRLLQPLCAAGVDIFHVSTRRFWEPAFAGSPKSLARWTRDITKRPVIAVGSAGLNRAHESKALGGHDNASAETASIDRVLRGLEGQDFDLIAVGRALLADSLWATKIKKSTLDTINPLRPEHLKQLI